MQATKPDYVAPTLCCCGPATIETRMKMAGPHEPGGLYLELGAGDLGFGL